MNIQSQIAEAIKRAIRYRSQSIADAIDDTPSKKLLKRHKKQLAKQILVTIPEIIFDEIISNRNDLIKLYTVPNYEYAISKNKIKLSGVSKYLYKLLKKNGIEVSKQSTTTECLYLVMPRPQIEKESDIDRQIHL